MRTRPRARLVGEEGRTTLADARRKRGYVRQDKRACCLLDLPIYLCTSWDADVGWVGEKMAGSDG